MAPKVVCFVNFKGGVGKTAVAVNLACTLASDSHGFRKRVLLIDLDAQASASIWLLGEDKWRHEVGERHQRTVFQIIKDRELGTDVFDFEEAIFQNPVPRCHAPYLDLLASTYRMMQAEDVLWSLKLDYPFSQLIRKRIQPYLNAYDYVLIDCPPNTYRVSQNGIAISNFIYVPAIPDYLSLVGFRELIERLYYLGGTLGFGKLIPVRGAIANGHRSNVIESRTGIEQLQLAITQLKNCGQIIPNCTLLDPYISYSTALPSAARRHLPVFALDTHSAQKVAEEYKNLARNFVSTLEAQ